MYELNKVRMAASLIKRSIIAKYLLFKISNSNNSCTNNYFIECLNNILFLLISSSASNTDLKVQKPTQNHIDFPILRFNFNFNLVESYILNSYSPPTQPPIQILNWSLNLQIYWIKQLNFLQENIDLSWAKTTKANYPNPKVSAHRLPSSNNWKRKAYEKEKHMSVAFLGQHCIVEDENAWIMDEKRNKENEFKEMNELKNKDESNSIH